MIPINDTEEFNSLLQNEMAVLAYFSHQRCNVCKTLKPKLINHFKETFTNFKLAYIDIELHPKIAAAHSVFTVPAIIIFFEGKEYIRKVRSMGISEISQQIERPYKLIFN